MKPSKCYADKQIVYSNRVRIGNWYESALLEEFQLNSFLKRVKRGDNILARFREMNVNLNTPTELTAATGSIEFGAKISLLAPYVPAHDAPPNAKNGLLLSGRLSSNEIHYTTELRDGCTVVGIPNIGPSERNAFTITSADYCDRKGEILKYNQECLLVLSSSVAKKKPLYLRYDPNAIPGLVDIPLFLSEHPVSTARWRMLPEQKPNITRFEREGQPVQVNTDLIVNHCATNTNLGINTRVWSLGFFGKVAHPLMKTCLDVYGKELPNNVWQIHTQYIAQ